VGLPASTAQFLCRLLAPHVLRDGRTYGRL
jgi:hypothetical protein